MVHLKWLTPQHLLLASGVQACDVSRVVAVLICVCLASIKRQPQPEGFDFVGYRPNHYVAKSPQHCFSMNASEPAPRKYKPTQVYAWRRTEERMPDQTSFKQKKGLVLDFIDT